MNWPLWLFLVISVGLVLAYWRTRSWVFPVLLGVAIYLAFNFHIARWLSILFWVLVVVVSVVCFVMGYHDRERLFRGDRRLSRASTDHGLAWSVVLAAMLAVLLGGPGYAGASALRDKINGDDSSEEIVAEKPCPAPKVRDKPGEPCKEPIQTGSLTPITAVAGSASSAATTAAKGTSPAITKAGETRDSATGLPVVTGGDPAQPFVGMDHANEANVPAVLGFAPDWETLKNMGDSQPKYQECFAARLGWDWNTVPDQNIQAEKTLKAGRDVQVDGKTVHEHSTLRFIQASMTSLSDEDVYKALEAKGYVDVRELKIVHFDGFINTRKSHDGGCEAFVDKQSQVRIVLGSPVDANDVWKGIDGTKGVVTSCGNPWTSIPAVPPETPATTVPATTATTSPATTASPGTTQPPTSGPATTVTTEAPTTTVVTVVSTPPGLPTTTIVVTVPTTTPVTTSPPTTVCDKGDCQPPAETMPPTTAASTSTSRVTTTATTSRTTLPPATTSPPVPTTGTPAGGTPGTYAPGDPVCSVCG